MTMAEQRASHRAAAPDRCATPLVGCVCISHRLATVSAWRASRIAVGSPLSRQRRTHVGFRGGSAYDADATRLSVGHCVAGLHKTKTYGFTLPLDGELAHTNQNRTHPTETWATNTTDKKRTAIRHKRTTPQKRTKGETRDRACKELTTRWRAATAHSGANCLVHRQTRSTLCPAAAHCA